MYILKTSNLRFLSLSMFRTKSLKKNYQNILNKSHQKNQPKIFKVVVIDTDFRAFLGSVI